MHSSHTIQRQFGIAQRAAHGFIRSIKPAHELDMDRLLKRNVILSECSDLIQMYKIPRSILPHHDG